MSEEDNSNDLIDMDRNDNFTDWKEDDMTDWREDHMFSYVPTPEELKAAKVLSYIEKERAIAAAEGRNLRELGLKNKERLERIKQDQIGKSFKTDDKYVADGEERELRYNTGMARNIHVAGRVHAKNREQIEKEYVNVTTTENLASNVKEQKVLIVEDLSHELNNSDSELRSIYALLPFKNQSIIFSGITSDINSYEFKKFVEFMPMDDFTFMTSDFNTYSQMAKVLAVCYKYNKLEYVNVANKLINAMNGKLDIGHQRHHSLDEFYKRAGVTEIVNKKQITQEDEYDDDWSERAQKMAQKTIDELNELTQFQEDTNVKDLVGNDFKKGLDFFPYSQEEGKLIDTLNRAEIDGEFVTIMKAAKDLREFDKANLLVDGKLEDIKICNNTKERLNQELLQKSAVDRFYDPKYEYNTHTENKREELDARARRQAKEIKENKDELFNNVLSILGKIEQKKAAEELANKEQVVENKLLKIKEPFGKRFVCWLFKTEARRKVFSPMVGLFAKLGWF